MIERTRDLNEHRQLGNPASLGLGLTITWLRMVEEKLRERASPVQPSPVQRASPEYILPHIRISPHHPHPNLLQKVQKY